MKRYYQRLRWKLYSNLSRKLKRLIPREYQASVEVVPSPNKSEDDEVVIIFKLPHSITKKLMWSFKVWKEN